MDLQWMRQSQSGWRSKVLAILLSVVMVGTVAPFGSVFSYGADQEEIPVIKYGDLTYPSLEQALEAVNDQDEEEDVLTLLADVDLGEQPTNETATEATEATGLTIAKDITLDLNGHTLSGQDPEALLTVAGAMLTLKTGETKGQIQNNSEVEGATAVAAKEVTTPTDTRQGQVTIAEGYRAVEGWEQAKVLTVEPDPIPQEEETPGEETPEDPVAETEDPDSDQIQQEAPTVAPAAAPAVKTQATDTEKIQTTPTPAPTPTYTLVLKTTYNGTAFTGTKKIGTIGTVLDGMDTRITNTAGPSVASKYKGIKAGETITITSSASKCYGVKSIKINGTNYGTSKAQKIKITSAMAKSGNITVTVDYGKTGKFILVDPGHGGGDVGSSSPGLINGVRYTEKARMWVLGQYLISELNSYSNIRAVCTRKSIESCPGVYNRGYASNGYDLFVSLHSNSATNYWSNTDYPLILAPVENTYYNALKTLPTDLGKMVKNTMGTSQGYQIWRKKNSYGTNWYGVIRGAAAVRTPGILIEHSFNTNYKAAAWLMNNTNLKRMATNEASLIAKWSGSTAKATTTASAKITLSGHNYPGTLCRTFAYSIKGKISSAKTIKRVEIGVVNGKTGQWTAQKYDNRSVGTTTFDISKAKSSVNFAKLGAGTYYYRIWVHTADGAKRVLNQPFTVKHIVIGGYTKPTTLKKGANFTLKGTIRCAVSMNRVEVGVVNGKTGRWTAQKYDDRKVNNKTFDISQADSRIQFDKLAAGQYYYRIWVHPKGGKATRILNLPFTIK